MHDREQMLLYSINHTAKETAKEFGVSESTVAHCRSKNGYKIKSKQYKYEAALVDFNNGMGKTKAAKKNNIGISAFGEWLKNGCSFTYESNKHFYKKDARVSNALLILNQDRFT